MKLSEALKKAQDWLGEQSAKAADSEAAAEAAQKAARARIDDDIATIKGEIAAKQENLRLKSEESKGKINSELIKAKMSMDAARDRLDAYAAERREKHDKAGLEQDMIDLVAYAEDCLALSALLADESSLAMLEAAAIHEEYVERFGEPTA